jgi:hypothetical protein
LLLGEQKADEVYFVPRKDSVKKIAVYGYRYHKKGKYKDSTLIKIEEYGTNGMLIAKVHIIGKKGDRWSRYNYTFNEKDEMVSFQYNYNGPDGNYGKSGDFEYNISGQLTLQVHSLANIKYTYYKDGRMKTKSYSYNNGNSENRNGWTDFYIYDEKNNLIHVDQDSSSKKQTSFYNEKNELVRNDYYPGVAYSTFSYDENGNCSSQMDYELNDNDDWDSTLYRFNYNNENRLTTTASSKKKGRITLDEERVYDPNGRLLKIILYRKGKRRSVKKYFYESY